MSTVAKAHTTFLSSPVVINRWHYLVHVSSILLTCHQSSIDDIIDFVGYGRGGNYYRRLSTLACSLIFHWQHRQLCWLWKERKSLSSIVTSSLLVYRQSFADIITVAIYSRNKKKLESSIVRPLFIYCQCFVDIIVINYTIWEKEEKKGGKRWGYLNIFINE